MLSGLFKVNLRMDSYTKLVKTAASCATICAIFLLIIKIIAWWSTHSISLLATIIDSCVDIASSLTNLLVLRFAARPADYDHEFGHGKAESLAALAQGMFVSGSAIFLILTGCQQIYTLNTTHPEATLLKTPTIGIVVMIISILITFGLVMFQERIIKRTGSQAIYADMLHYKSDLLMNCTVLLALLLSWFGLNNVDPLFAILIGCYILYNAWKMSYDAIQTLLDRVLPEREQQEIVQIIKSKKLMYHELRTRQAGHEKFIQLHLELDDHLPLIDAHEIAFDLEQALLARFPNANIIIHQDPFSAVAKEIESGERPSL